MKQYEFKFSVSTKGRGIYAISKEVEIWMQSQNISSGLLTLFIPHTSASLLIQENADPDVLKDLDRFLTDLFPMATLYTTTNRKGLTTCRLIFDRLSPKYSCLFQ